MSASSNKSSRARAVFYVLTFIFGLTFVFFFDDIVLLILCERLFGFTPDAATRTVIGVFLFLLNLWFAALVWQGYGQKPQTGSEGMLNARGVVTQKQGRILWVRVYGELWRARSGDELQIGDDVTVIGIEGLTLHVARTRTGEMP